MATKTRLYQIYDLTAGASAGPIMGERRDGPAIRAFHGVLEARDTMPNRYPDQFELRYLGEQDDETGVIEPVQPTTIATGAAWAEQQAAQRQNSDGQTWPMEPSQR